MPRKTPTKKSRSAAEDSTNTTSFNVTEHVLVPSHELVSAEEKAKILARYGVQPSQLPRINPQDPAIRHLGVKQGDLIKITRKSQTAGESTFYRIVASE
jgi:DNA-directed RNA polymerase subunit H